MDALRLLHMDGVVTDAVERFRDFVCFSTSLAGLDGSTQSLPQAMPGSRSFCGVILRQPAVTPFLPKPVSIQTVPWM